MKELSHSSKKNCDYETALKADLKRHIEAVYEGIKPLKCNICDYKFTRKGSLKKHTEFVHEGIKQVHHMCL